MAARAPARGRALRDYNAKRDFARTPEPRADARAARPAPERALAYTIQKHAARRLHYDLRLEWDGSLKSWAVPKGPSLDPGERRLAVRTEDHPLEYLHFQGEIPAGEYGAGEMTLWDHGAWTPLGDVERDLARGKLEFRLEGEKLHGAWKLVRMGGRADADKEQWLLIKAADDQARSGADADIVALRPEGVAVATDGDPSELDAQLPASLSPQLATLVDVPPRGEGWVYEVKYDGYRMLARIDGDDVRLVSRNGRDWTARMPRVRAALAALRLGSAWLDGEVVVVGPDGTTSFQALQNAFENGASDRPIVYFVFDVLHLGGESLAALPLLTRKARLEALLADVDPAAPVRYAGHLPGPGATALAKACELGLEGLIGKRGDAPYIAGRTRQWVKLKCRRRQEFVIAGWTDPGGTRPHFGSLLLGYYDGHGKLRYAGRVGTGFGETTLARLAAELRRIGSPRAPFETPPAGANVHWVRPRLVAEVAFAGWTDEGLVRQASFVGLREDKTPTSVGRESAVPVERLEPGQPAAARRAEARRPASREGTGKADAHVVTGVRITNPERELFPGTGITKLELARYVEALGDRILAHVRGRPLMVVRCPGGSAGSCFHQKHRHRGMPDSIDAVDVDGDGDDTPHIVANRVEALIGLVQFGVIELHTWGATAPQLGRPDRIVLDLDPDESLGWDRVREAALLVRALLDALELPAFLKTTGGKGLHVVVPLQRRHGWDEVKGFAKAIADHLASVFPDRFTASMAKSRRGGRIFLDYLRNGEGATAVAAFSVRARAGAPVSLPVPWEALDDDIRGGHFNLRNVATHVARTPDPWADYAKRAARLTAAMRLKLDA